jgi:hypothetical protein
MRSIGLSHHPHSQISSRSIERYVEEFCSLEGLTSSSELMARIENAITEYS